MGVTFGYGFTAKRNPSLAGHLVLGTLHAVLAGSNAQSLAVSGPGIACLTALAAALLGRYHKNLTRRRTRRRAKHVLTVSA